MGSRRLASVESRRDHDRVSRVRGWRGLSAPAASQVPLPQTEFRGQEAGGGERGGGGGQGDQGQDQGRQEAQQVPEEDRERQGAGADEEVQSGF